MSINITAEQALQWLNGQATGNAMLGISLNTRLIAPLQNQLWNYMVLKSSATPDLIGNGKYGFRVSYLPKSENYAIGNLTNQTPQTDVIWTQDIIYRDVKIVSETFDYDMIEKAPEILADYLSRFGTAMNFDITQYMYSTFKAFGDAHPAQTCYIPALAKEDQLLSDNDAKAIQQKLAKKRVQIARIINNKYVGVDKNEFVTVIDPMGAVDLSTVLTRLNASQGAFEVSKALMTGDTAIFRNIISDNFIGVSIPRGVSMSRDVDYDMTDVAGFIVHSDFLALPVRDIKLVSRINGDGNVEHIAKYAYTHAILRPELFAMLIKTMKAWVEGDYVKHNAFMEKATFTSSDTRKATIDANTGKITPVQGATGEVTFTATLSNNDSASVKITLS